MVKCVDMKQKVESQAHTGVTFFFFLFKIINFISTISVDFYLKKNKNTNLDRYQDKTWNNLNSGANETEVLIWQRQTINTESVK